MTERASCLELMMNSLQITIALRQLDHKYKLAVSV